MMPTADVKKQVRPDIHVIPTEGITEVKDSIDSCIEAKKVEVKARNMSAISACPSRKSYVNRRCFTAIERPKRAHKFCEACSYRLVKEIEQDCIEGQQNVLVHGMYRSKSDLDVHSNFSTESFTTQLLRERSQVFITHSPNDMQHGRKTALGNHGTPSREEVFVAKTTVPKKGLIKLTSFDKELKNPMLFNKQEKEVLPMQAVREKQRKQQISEKKKKMLIRRKDIQNQVDLGTLYLANEEEKNLIETQIENYTLADLHQNLNELTKKIKQPPTENLPRGGNKQISNTKSTTPQPRGLALPAINTINIF